MKNITKSIAWLFSAFLFVFFSISPVRAVFIQSGDSVTLPKDKVINEAALITGATLLINSDINGDLYCAGQNIVINGYVKGDIACMGQSVKINGIVDGNIRVMAQTVEINGQVSRNLTTGSQGLILGPKTNIKGDIFFGSQNAQLGGLIGRDLAGAGETVTITGSLARNASIAGNNISIMETAKIGGNLDYYTDKTTSPSIEKKNIRGTVTRHDVETPQKTEVKNKMTKVTSVAHVISFFFSILSFAVLGLVLIYFDRKNTEKRLSSIIEKPLVMGLIGLTSLIVAPFVFFILMVTMIGIPLAFVVLLVFIIALIIASLYPSAVYGKVFFEKILKKEKISLYWKMAVGVVLLGAVSCIPVVGWTIAFISFCLGLGAFITSLMPEKK